MPQPTDIQKTRPSRPLLTPDQLIGKNLPPSTCIEQLIAYMEAKPHSMMRIMEVLEFTRAHLNEVRAGIKFLTQIEQLQKGEIGLDEIKDAWSGFTAE